MIYLFAGDDATTRHNSYEKFIESLPKDADTVFIGRNDFDKMHVESLYSGAGLFFTQSNIVFTGIFEREEIADFILDRLENIAKSKNNFIFLEGKLSKSILDAFKKARAELNIFELPKGAGKKGGFDSFSLANAFAARDKIHLWIYFRQAMDNNIEMEPLVGILFWKAKDMILKKNFSKFSLEELQNFTSKLSCLLPEARKKGNDDEAAFEQFLLEAF